MCRSITVLFNFDPPATQEEIHKASLQFVRKISGFSKPSGANKVAFDNAVDEVVTAAQRLLNVMITNARPKDRVREAERAQARNLRRFGVS